MRHVSAFTMRSSRLLPFIKKNNAENRLPAISSSMIMMRIFSNMMCLALDNLSDYAVCAHRLQLTVPNKGQQKMQCKMTGKQIW